MSTVSRSDVFVRDERGPSWFDEFLRSMAKVKQTSVQEILDIINNKKAETVESVVQSYREQVGLDIVHSSNDDGNSEVKTASIKRLSFRHNASDIGPIAPMKLKKLKDPDQILKNFDDSDIIVQIKLDGFKTQAVKDSKGAVKVYTRRGEDFSSNVPNLITDLEKAMKNGSFMLGELVWEGSDGKQSISDIQTVVGSSPENAKKKIDGGGGKIVFYVYDLLWNNGDNITDKPYTERYKNLSGAVGQKLSTIKVVKNYTYSDKDKAINDALKVNAEGIVLKPKDSKYKYSKKGGSEPVGEWAKYKPGSKAKTDEVILNKYTKGKEKIIFPMYQYKDSSLFEVGQLSGMSKEDESKLKKDIDSGKSVVVEVTFQERMPSGKFRHVGWSRFRPDKPAKEVKFSKTAVRLSVRHIFAEEKSIVDIIKADPDIVTALESICRHSGGTKKIQSLINFLRSRMGNDVSFSDDGLIQYLSDIKDKFKDNVVPKTGDEYVGMVGVVDREDSHDDDVADYTKYNGEAK